MAGSTFEEITAIRGGEAVDIGSGDHVASQTSRAIWVGGAGAIKVDTSGGDTLTFSGVTAGYLLVVEATKVYQTGTDATNMLLVW